MKLGIIGGTFDPIHIGHIEISLRAKKQYDLDKVIFCPVNIPSSKKPPATATTNQRIEMCKLAIVDFDFFELSMIDIRRGGVSYSINTVNDILEIEGKQHTFFLIVGEDNALEITEWERSEELLSKVKVIVAPRKHSQNVLFTNSYNAINFNEIDVSSSNIRENIKSRKKWKHFVPRQIINYIVESKLYLNE